MHFAAQLFVCLLVKGHAIFAIYSYNSSYNLNKIYLLRCKVSQLEGLEAYDAYQTFYISEKNNGN